ncbi:MAG: hypothetical protein WCW68_02850 [Methanothrix sp.]
MPSVIFCGFDIAPSRIALQWQIDLLVYELYDLREDSVTIHATHQMHKAAWIFNCP